MSAPTGIPSMELHPDIVELRARYERASVTPFAQGVEALAILVGLYLAVSPWVVGFNGFPTLAINNLVTGVAYAVLIGGFGPAFERSHARGWAATLIGLWTIIAPWCVSGSVAITRTIISNVIAGLLALCLGLAMCSLARMATRRLAMQSGQLPGRADRLFRPPVAEPPVAPAEHPEFTSGPDVGMRDTGGRRDTPRSPKPGEPGIGGGDPGESPYPR